MKQSDFKEFTYFLTGVGLTLDKELRPEQIKLYFEVLKEEFESVEEFKKSAIKLTKSWKYGYFPKPAHFIEQTKITDDELSIIATEAWSYVIDAIRDGAGYTKGLECEDTLTEHSISAIGGIDRLAKLTSKELEWKKREFIAIFKSAYKSKRVANITHHFMPLSNKSVIIPKMINFDKEAENNYLVGSTIQKSIKRF